jgi:hypothetical protein
MGVYLNHKYLEDVYSEYTYAKAPSQTEPIIYGLPFESGAKGRSR